jgi:hypothetical protein
MTNEELKKLADCIAVELNDRKNKEKTALLKTLRETVERLYEVDSNFYMSSSIRTDCCNELMEIDLFDLLRDYFDI